MAIKGTKRSAASSVGPKKKAKVGCKIVAKALAGNPMLASVVTKTLGVYADERHEVQAKFTTMIGEALTTLQSSLEEAVATAQAAVDGAEVEKANRALAVEDADADLKAKEQVLAAATETMKADAEARNALEAQLKEAESAQKAGEKEIAEAGKTKEDIEGAKAKFTGMMDAAGAAPDVKVVKKVLDQIGCEAEAASFIPETLKKEPSARGPFDSIILKTIGDTLEGKLASVTETLSTAETATEQRKAAVEAATAALTSATDKLGASTTAKEEAVAAAQTAKSTLKDAKKAVSSYASDMKSADKKLISAKIALANFMEGALASFTSLKDMVKPPPEPEKPEEPAAPAEEAPAEVTA